MSKRLKRQAQYQKDESLNLTTLTQEITPPRPARAAKPLEPMNDTQKAYISSIHHNRITFGIGPAGTGKTYIAARIAAQQLREKKIERIYLSRPAVESGRSIGFLKGTLEEKMQPYMAAFGQAFRDGLGEGHFEYHMRMGRIEILPINFIQGRSLDEKCYLLVDEAQNTTPEEMKMILTRIGKGARFVITGDPQQKMIPGKSGLIDGLRKIRYLESIGVAEFSRSEIVRDDLVQHILNAYDEENGEEEVQLDLPGFITGKS
ncbi:MAG: PhoH family protein [Rhodobacterales bacterium]|nr:PhoH family protein [Rhodobacterales bacterium]